MAVYGIQTWDANGVPNNTGIVQVMTLGHVYLSAGQVSGSWAYTVPPGFRVQAVQSPVTGDAYSDQRRKLNFNGNTLTISNAVNDFSANTMTADEAWLVVYMVRA